MLFLIPVSLHLEEKMKFSSSLSRKKKKNERFSLPKRQLFQIKPVRLRSKMGSE